MFGLDSREAFTLGEQLAYEFEFNAYLERVNAFHAWVDSLDDSVAPEWVAE